MQPVDGVEGDIMDFYLSGDVAPGGRFAFRFTTDEISHETGGSGFPVLAVVGIAAAAVLLVCAAITIPIAVKRRKNGKGEKLERRGFTKIFSQKGLTLLLPDGNMNAVREI